MGRASLALTSLRNRLSCTYALTDSGYAKYIALPLLRAFYGTKRDDINSITKDEAIGVIRKCMEVLYYRVLRHAGGSDV